MGGLLAGLRIGLKSLSNMETGLSVVSENIANATTPGYSRKQVLFEPGPSLIMPFGELGTGAQVDRITSLRDRFIERRLLAELQYEGFLRGQQFGMDQIEAFFVSSQGAGIGDQFSRFMNSFLELAADPSSLSLRQATLSEACRLTARIQNTALSLDRLDMENRQQITESVEKVNFLLSQIGQINNQLAPLLASGQDGGSLQDQRQELINSLSQEIGIQAYETESGQQMISTNTGRILLAGNEFFALQVEDSSSGILVCYAGEDISGEITGGKLGGYLNVQNAQLPTYRDGLNRFAAELVSSVNSLHQTGTGLDGSTGLDFFSASPGNEAKSISVSVTDPRSLAAGLGPSGDGSLAQQIADLRDQPFGSLDDDTLLGFYSRLVLEVGLESRSLRGSLQLQSQELIVQQLQNQRDAVSGVSLDEEAAQLLQYQRSYQASARLIRVLDEAINLIRWE